MKIHCGHRAFDRSDRSYIHKYRRLYHSVNRMKFRPFRPSFCFQQFIFRHFSPSFLFLQSCSSHIAAPFAGDMPDVSFSVKYTLVFLKCKEPGRKNPFFCKSDGFYPIFSSPPFIFPKGLLNFYIVILKTLSYNVTELGFPIYI